VAPKAKAFGLRVVTYDPYVSDEILKRAGVERVEFGEMVKISDYISIHSPLTPETNHLFNAQVFCKMKPGAYLLNTARGPIVDEVALAQALDQGHLAGAGLDVMETEPPPSSPLFGRDNVILNATYQFLFGGVAGRSADQSSRGGVSCFERASASKPSQYSSKSGKRQLMSFMKRKK
jgi:lactate dehydrogenase-like 2-hydroxyacid dehydrogenase